MCRTARKTRLDVGSHHRVPTTFIATLLRVVPDLCLSMANKDLKPGNSSARHHGRYRDERTTTYDGDYEVTFSRDLLRALYRSASQKLAAKAESRKWLIQMVGWVECTHETHQG